MDGGIGFEHGHPTDISCLVASPDGKKLAGTFTDYYMAGVFVIDMETGRIRKLLNESPWTLYAADWYGTGAAKPRWVLKTFGGVSFSPDSRSVVFCSNHAKQAEKFANNGWQPLQRSFSLFAMPIPASGSAEAQPAKPINLYLPPDEETAGQAASNKGVMLPGTATTWPAQADW